MSATKDVVHDFIRNAKNMTKKYSTLELKVLKMTSNQSKDPPPGFEMAELAEASLDHHQFIRIVLILFKRLMDKGKNWRHVDKALLIIDYLLHVGNEEIIQYTLDNLPQIQTLLDFQYFDYRGFDFGGSIRLKADDILNLLKDDAADLLQTRKYENIDEHIRKRFSKYYELDFRPANQSNSERMGNFSDVKSTSYFNHHHHASSFERTNDRASLDDARSVRSVQSASPGYSQRGLTSCDEYYATSDDDLELALALSVSEADYNARYQKVVTPVDNMHPETVAWPYLPNETVRAQNSHVSPKSKQPLDCHAFLPSGTLDQHPSCYSYNDQLDLVDSDLIQSDSKVSPNTIAFHKKVGHMDSLLDLDFSQPSCNKSRNLADFTTRDSLSYRDALKNNSNLDSSYISKISNCHNDNFSNQSNATNDILNHLISGNSAENNTWTIKVLGASKEDNIISVGESIPKNIEENENTFSSNHSDFIVHNQDPYDHFSIFSDYSFGGKKITGDSTNLPSSSTYKKS